MLTFSSRLLHVNRRVNLYNPLKTNKGKKRKGEIKFPLHQTRGFRFLGILFIKNVFGPKLRKVTQLSRRNVAGYKLRAKHARFARETSHSHERTNERAGSRINKILEGIT